MAEKIESYKARHVGAKQVYPWDEWLDGSIWRLTHCEDFECSIVSIGCYIRATAKKRGFKCSVYVEGESVVIVPR